MDDFGMRDDSPLDNMDIDELNEEVDRDELNIDESEGLGKDIEEDNIFSIGELDVELDNEENLYKDVIDKLT